MKWLILGHQGASAGVVGGERHVGPGRPLTHPLSYWQLSTHQLLICSKSTPGGTGGSQGPRGANIDRPQPWRGTASRVLSGAVGAVSVDEHEVPDNKQPRTIVSKVD